MLVESWAIIIVVLALGYIYLRSGRANYGFSVMPLTLVPLGYLVSSPLSRYVNDVFRWDPKYFRIVVVLAMMVTACVLMAALASGIKSKTSRRIYMAICAGFTFILSNVFIFNILA